MISFSNLTKMFADGSVALDAVSLSIPKGQFCAIIGSSGAGKSTLLRAVNGLTQPSRGDVIVGGVTVTPATFSVIRPRIGMIHQHFNLVNRSSVARNVLAGALPAISTWRALLSLFPAKYQRRACELVAAVGLEELHLRRRVSELSGGQQQRVGIARAFMLSPEIVLADEPIASLDPRISREILQLLKQQSAESGATVLCTLHQIELAREFADRIIALKRGRVVFDGAAGDFSESAATELFSASHTAPAAGRRAHLTIMAGRS